MGFRGLPILLLLAACGGGGGGASPVTISGQLSVAGLSSAALLDLSADEEPNDNASEARPFPAGFAEGTIDAATDPVDAFRVVAARPGTYSLELETEGARGEALLYCLDTGEAATALEVREGDVFDVVVRATEGSGSYRVTLREGAADPAPRHVPDGYCDCGDGFVPGEVVAALAPGRDALEVATTAGLVCLSARGGPCLFRDPAARDEATFGALSDVLATCARLEASGAVRYAEPNRLRQLAALPNDPRFQEQWALEQVRVPAAWEIANSTPVVIAVVDSGIRQHPDLVANLIPGYDFEADDADPTDPTPNFSHGTQVASVIAAVGDNSTGVTGVLWSAQVMPLRAFDTAGFGTSFDIANAILYAAGLPNESGTVPAVPASVVNMSFASAASSTTESDACTQARAAGLFLCAATGNQGTTVSRYPAGYPAVVGVGATTSAGQRASYSNYGPAVDLVAPGGFGSDGVLVAAVVSGNQYGYSHVTGTSFASPHVAAVAALLLGLAPLQADDVEMILLGTAQDIGAVGLDQQTGHGIVDAYAAALAALDQTPPALYPFEEVEVRLRSNLSGQIVASTRTSAMEGLAWSLPDVPHGKYTLEAGTDRNHDGSLSGPGELFGVWQDGATLTVDGELADLDFELTLEE